MVISEPCRGVQRHIAVNYTPHDGNCDYCGVPMESREPCLSEELRGVHTMAIGDGVTWCTNEGCNAREATLLPSFGPPMKGTR